MTWLYLPSECLPSAPAGAESNSVSSSSSGAREYAPWGTVNGKPTQRPSSWRGWKTRPWITRLSGTTLEPSTADAGVERWISSLQASPALRFRSPASARATTTSAGSGRTSSGSGRRRARRGSSSKTSPGSAHPTLGIAVAFLCSEGYLTSGQGLLSGRYNSYCETLPRAGTLRNGSLYRRNNWVPRISGIGCSSWPTPMSGAATRTAQGGIQLSQAARGWPTQDAGTSQNGHGRRGGRPDNGSQSGERLEATAKMWPTPPAGDVAGGRTTKGKARQGETGLRKVAQKWPTPKQKTGGP